MRGRQKKAYELVRYEEDLSQNQKHEVGDAHLNEITNRRPKSDAGDGGVLSTMRRGPSLEEVMRWFPYQMAAKSCLLFQYNRLRAGRGRRQCC